MKLTAIISAATIALASSALAQDSGLQMGGSMQGSANTFAGSAGASFGNGSSMSEAGQFAGSMGSLKGSAKLGANNGRMEMQVTGESYTQGFDKSRVNGSSMAGGLRGGMAETSGNYWGSGNASFGSGNWGGNPQ